MFFHIFGTRASYMESIASLKFGDMMIVPSMANFKSTNTVLTFGFRKEKFHSFFKVY